MQAQRDDLARAQLSLQQQAAELDQASRYKSEFLANMSHELRTPLNAILGYTELISDSVYGEPPEKMRTVLARISHNGKHLLGLINDVLDLSKVEAGRLDLNRTDIDVEDTVDAALRFFRERSRKAGRGTTWD